MNDPLLFLRYDHMTFLFQIRVNIFKDTDMYIIYLENNHNALIKILTETDDPYMEN